MFFRRRSSVRISALLAFILIGTQIQITLPAAAKIKSPLMGTGSEWSEKERIGFDVPVETWRDNKLAPWAVLLCVHGLGLHNTSYADFGQKMADQGVATYALDVRGFGSWKNTNENKVVDFAAALTDIHSTLIALRKAHPKIPIVLLGESMGGALAIQATAMDEDLVDGLIASVPSGLRYGEKLTSVKVMVGLVTRPHKQIKVGNKIVKQATDDPELRKQWSEDPGARMTMSPKELLAFQNFMEKNVPRARQINNTPVLFVQGGSDKLVKGKGTVLLFKDIGSKDKDLVWLGESEHLIFEEGQFDQHVVEFVSGWIQKHVVQPFTAKHCQSPEFDIEKANKQAAGRLLLAQGYIKLEDWKNAMDQLKQVLVLGRGSKLAQDAYETMLGLPQEMIAPKTGPQTQVTMEEIKFTSHEGAMQNDKPSVLIFCADWVKPCKDLEAPLQSLYDQYGKDVNFVHIDADDPNSQNLVRKYSIGPLPAILYLSANNVVMSYTLGLSDETGMRKEVLKLMNEPTAKAEDSGNANQ